MNVPTKLPITDAIILLKGKIEIAYKRAELARPSMDDMAVYIAFDEGLRITRSEQRTIRDLFDIIYDEMSHGASAEAVLDSVRIDASRIVSYYREIENEGHKLPPEDEARVALARSILVAAAKGNASLIEVQSI